MEKKPPFLPTQKSNVDYPVELKKWQYYESLLSDLLQERGDLYDVMRDIASSNQSVALYGFTEAAKAILYTFKKLGVTVRYVVENSEVDGVQTFPRGQVTYPSVDVLFICDIVMNEKIIQRLKHCGMELIDVKSLIKPKSNWA